VDPAGNSAPEPKKPPGRPFPKGVSGNPSGRPKALVAIQKMLDDEHRSLDSMREVFSRLKALALGQVVTVTGKDGEVDIELEAEPAYMKLYLERVLGPVKDIEPDLSDAPPEVINYLRSLQ
jgi:hypothetical protein